MDDFDATIPPKRVREPDAPDLDATLPPKRMLETERAIPQDFDPDRTIPNRRMRREMGEFSVGDVIAYRYQVISVLGRGAMGVVYRCFDKVASIEVALKGLPPELAGNDWEMKEIRRNFQLVHNLHHPNIASYNTIELDQTSGGYFLVMEFVDGVELRTYMENNRPDHATIINITTAIALALDYAHAQQILHRDIKPGNIMIDRNGIVKILDFGLAAQIHSSMSKVSMVQDSSGTAPYMSPEQWRGRRQNASCDQYALGVVAYEMFAGFLPFESTDHNVLRSAVLNETPEPLANVTPSIQYAVNKALGKTPEERFPNCTAFAQALTAPVKRESKSKSGKIILLVVLLAILCAGGIGTYFALQSNPKVIYSSDNNSFIENKAREEQERKAREEQERKQQEEQKRKQREEQERKAREEQERKAREEQERKERLNRQLEAGQKAYDAKNWQQAAEAFEEVLKIDRSNATAQKLLPDAQYNIGENYYNSQDYSNAVKWYRKAAEQGQATAQYNLGVYYGNGWGVDKNYGQAAQWYRKAAEQGHARAQYNLGVYYDNGMGVNKDEYQAVQWYRKAAEQGNASAQYNLGVCYQYGQGVERDEKQAVYWYRKAAEQGDADARKQLDNMGESY